MKNWLRLTLVVATVGGGFAGFSMTAAAIFSPQSHGSTTLFYALIAALYLFVLISGLVFIHNPARTTPILIAMVIQIPVVSSPIIVYQFAAGLLVVVAVNLSDPGVSGTIRFGYQCQLFFLQATSWSAGINIFAAVLAVLLLKQPRKTKTEQLVATAPPLNNESR